MRITFLNITIFAFYFLTNLLLKSVFSKKENINSLNDLKEVTEKEIDITLPENKNYYDDIKQILKNLVLKDSNTEKLKILKEFTNATTEFKVHQIFKIFKTVLKTDSTDNSTILVSNLLLNELEEMNFFEVKITKNYLTQENSTLSLQKTSQLFNPSEKNNTSIKDMISPFLKYKDLNKEYYFYKGDEEHSCENYQYDSENPLSISSCHLKQRNMNYTFLIGFYNEDLNKNVSQYQNCFYFDKFNGNYEIYDIERKENGLLNFIISDSESKVIKDFYNYMNDNNLIPEEHIDPNSNDQSEGGFNVQIRRSVWVILLTGFLTSLTFLGLFFFAKAKKKIHVPADGFEKVEETE